MTDRIAPRWVVKLSWTIFAAVLFALVAGALYQQAARAAPKAQSREECAAYADMALVAATAGRHAIEKSTVLAMLPDLYGPLYEERGDEAREISANVIAAGFAWQKANPRAPPAAFANLVVRTCVSTHGNLDAIFGTGI